MLKLLKLYNLELNWRPAGKQALHGTCISSQTSLQSNAKVNFLTYLVLKLNHCCILLFLVVSIWRFLQFLLMSKSLNAADSTWREVIRAYNMSTKVTRIVTSVPPVQMKPLLQAANYPRGWMVASLSSACRYTSKSMLAECLHAF